MAEPKLSNLTLIESESQYDSKVKNNKYVLVDFFATWCPPCKRMSPIIHKIAANNDELEVLTVDVDQQQKISGKSSIEAMPTFIIFNGGSEYARIVGADEAKLQKTLGELIPGYKKI